MNPAFLLLFFCAPAWAHQLSVRGPEPEVVRLGGQAVVTLSVDGAPGVAELASTGIVEGLDVVAAPPSTSILQTVVDGRVTEQSRTSWQITLEPSREGVFDVPPLRVEVGGQTLTSEPLRVEAVRDPRGGENAFAEVWTERDTYFLQEAIHVRLRFGFERTFLEGNLIQLFPQRLDVPAQLQARWLRDLPGALSLADGTGEPAGVGHLLTFALEDTRAEAKQVEDRIVDGRPFTVLEMEKHYLANCSGELVIPGPVLRFAYGTRFNEDFVNGRVAADRRDSFVVGRRVTLRIHPLPEEGRPEEFTGAVGRFSVQADADPRDVMVGDSLKLRLRIEGEGNLEIFEPPRLESLEGFHVYGRIDDETGTRRTIAYDLAPQNETVKEVPSIAFAFFDPSPPSGYRTVRTPPIPIAVRRQLDGQRRRILSTSEARRAVPGDDDIFDIKPLASPASAVSPRRIPPAILVGALVAPWILALGLLGWLRVRERDERDPDGVRARGAAEKFRIRAGVGDTDLSEAFAEYLSARLRCPAAAVIAPGLAKRLAASGVPAELAERAAARLETLIAARYGDSASNSALKEIGESVRAVVDELEVAFRTPARGR